MAGKRILLVDDEALVAQSVKLLLQLDGHSIEYAADAATALGYYAPGKYDLVITDNRMAGMSGLELAETIRRRNPGQRIMMLTGFPPSRPSSAIDLIMVKPFSGRELRDAVVRLTAD